MIPDSAAAFDFLRLERYQEQVAGAATGPGSDSLIRQVYYLVRPMLPVLVRKHLQRYSLRNWRSIPFPDWPIDASVEKLEHAIWTELLRVTGESRLPFIWFWPQGCRIGGMLTHDVETAVGRDSSGVLMAMEAEYGFVSSFQVIPEQRYEVDEEYLQVIRGGGCEVAVHGLNHDGHLFDDEELFSSRAETINGYLKAWNARGFRSPILYRRQEWLRYLDISYDMSVPNTARLDPQRGGCCTVRPYFVGDILELPLTTIQDYSLLAVLNDSTPTVWWQQLEEILRHAGLASFLVHPDYVHKDPGKTLYRELLERLALLRDSGQAWFGTPGTVNDWWRSRAAMKLVRGTKGWSVHGVDSEQARVAWAVGEGDRIVYEIEG